MFPSALAPLRQFERITGRNSHTGRDTVMRNKYSRGNKRLSKSQLKFIANYFTVQQIPCLFLLLLYLLRC